MGRLDKIRLADNLEKIAQYDITRNKTLGAAYFVYQEGNFALEKCYGTVSPGSTKRVANNALFRLASMTKPVTAIATLILVDRGLLSLDDSLDKYLPQFEDVHIIRDDMNDFGRPNNKPTIRSILNHTSGIGSSEEKMQRMSDEDKKTLDAAVNFFAKAGLDFEPASKQWYSGMGAFDGLTKIIEVVSGKDYLDFLTEEIFIPCNMLDTTFLPNIEQLERMVEMHNLLDGKSVIHKMFDGCIYEDFPWNHYVGGAGLVSTLHDYCSFAKMLLNRGRTDSRRILREDTFNLLCTPQVSDAIMHGSERWGLGVRVIAEDNYPNLPVGSFGWSGAYGSHFWVDPVNRIFAVFMKNSKFDGGSGNESAVNFEQAVYSSFV